MLSLKVENDDIHGCGCQPDKPKVFSGGHQQKHATIYMITLLLVMLLMQTVLYCCILLGMKLLILLLNVGNIRTIIAIIETDATNINNTNLQCVPRASPEGCAYNSITVRLWFSTYYR